MVSMLGYGGRYTFFSLLLNGKGNIEWCGWLEGEHQFTQTHMDLFSFTLR